MAITHNLSNIADNLSGYDPIDGEIDGTTFGRSWYVWKIFDGLRAFDSRVTLISGSSPTPEFLQPESGSLFEEPTKTANSNDIITFYYSDDVGLAQTPANAMVYEWYVNTGTNTALWRMRMRFAKSGSVTYAPTTLDSYTDDNTSTSNYPDRVPCYATWITLNQNSYINKFIFWKSSNMQLILPVDRTSGDYKGGLYWCKNFPNGAVQSSGSINEGVNLNMVAMFNGYTAGGNWGGCGTVIEGFSEQEYGTALTQTIESMFSANNLPDQLYSYDATNHLIASTLRLGYTVNGIFKAVSDEIEGVLIAHPTAMAAAAGSIVAVNSKYYLMGRYLDDTYDGNRDYRVMFELGT